MKHKLFFPLSGLENQDSKTPDYPTEENSPMSTTIRKLQLLKNFNLAGFKKIVGKRTGKSASNTKKMESFNTACSWVSKGIWALSLTLSSNLCFAATADGYAFTGALFNIMNELKGAPIAIITAIGIIAAGFFWVFKGHDVGLKQVVGALVGGGLVIAAPTLVMMVPGMTGALI